jgi:hypothetical protein
MDAYRLSSASSAVLIPDKKAVQIWRASNGPGAAEHLEPPG